MGGLISEVLLDRLPILMKSASLSTIVVAILTMTLVTQNAIADTTFDGTWFVTMSAHNYQNPNSTMSLAYAWHFSMTVALVWSRADVIGLLNEAATRSL